MPGLDGPPPPRKGEGAGRQRTAKFWLALGLAGDIADRIRAVVTFMHSLDLDLAIFLWGISWNVPDLVNDPHIKFERAALLNSYELPQILHNWHNPPYLNGVIHRSRHAHVVLNKFAVGCVQKLVAEEIENLQTLWKLYKPNLSVQSLLDIDVEEMLGEVQANAPTTWSILNSAAQSPAQIRRNTHKSPDLPILYQICVSVFMRSSHSSKLHKLVTVFLRSCSLPAKVYDSLHALGLCMNQAWAYDAVDQLSTQAVVAMSQDIKSYPFFAGHDNVNIAFRAQEQRLANQTNFDSGTAGTVYIIKNPTCSYPSVTELRARISAGEKNPITPEDIFLLEATAAPRLREQAVHRILYMLLDSAPFDLASYRHRESSLLEPPAPIDQLPLVRTTQYMLPTVHIEEASYEGNARVIDIYITVLGLGSPSERKRSGLERIIPWSGDQMTGSRIRGLQNFRAGERNSEKRLQHLFVVQGFFHTVMNMALSLHKQFYGTLRGFGLVQAFQVLQRKGLHSPSISGNFHHNLHEAIKHVAQAHIRDIWLEVAGVEDLSDLRDRTPAELLAFAEQIYADFCSPKAWKAHQRFSACDSDDVLAQAILWNRDVMDYLELTEAIHTGDVGRMENVLPRLLFRFLGAGHSNYAMEVADMLQRLNREWTDNMKTFIKTNCWLVNTTGRAGGFCPVDQNQEHNVRDAKTALASVGPHAQWAYVEKLSPAIPALRSIKDHVEGSINPYRRYRRHTSPSHEEDVTILSGQYHNSKVHHHTPGRKLGSEHKAEDIRAKGTKALSEQNWLQNWAKNRTRPRDTREVWPGE